jgi:molybdopterin synthase sulfur carrier subunit
MPLVKLYANLRSATGKKEVQVSGKNIRGVLEHLTQDYPGLAPFLFEHGKPRSRVILTVNGQAVDIETSLEPPLSEDDQLAIFPPVAGG